jgi:hypothetical protein
MTTTTQMTHDNRGDADCPFGYVYFGDATQVRAVYALHVHPSSPPAPGDPQTLVVHTGSGGWVDPNAAQRLAAAQYLEGAYPEATVLIELPSSDGSTSAPTFSEVDAF